MMMMADAGHIGDKKKESEVFVSRQEPIGKLRFRNGNSDASKDILSSLSSEEF